MVAGDTFRAAAIEQLKIWSDRTGCPIISHKEGADPAAVVYDGVISGVSRKMDVIMVDTAGRLHNKVNLMKELEKVKRVIKKADADMPVETYLVIDATSGQNGLIQARTFKQAVDIDGIILTKMDGTAKGGIIMQIVRELQVPVRFIGVGESVDDLKPFDAEEFISALFD
jgi:fused signal recognition particle receptor